MNPIYLLECYDGIVQTDGYEGYSFLSSVGCVCCHWPLDIPQFLANKIPHRLIYLKGVQVVKPFPHQGEGPMGPGPDFAAGHLFSLVRDRVFRVAKKRQTATSDPRQRHRAWFYHLPF